MLVSVCMITYGHENYIKQAIEGVLTQEGDFEVELIIVNDCSPDSTNEIITNLIKTHSKAHRIKYWLNKKNKGIVPNFLFSLQQCTGKYIALCEGDDYWTSPQKLQMQVKFLEANIDFSICFTDYQIFNQNSGIFSSPGLGKKFAVKNIFTIHDIIRSNFIPTLTSVFRNNLSKNFPVSFSEVFPGDWPLHILNARYGKIKFLPFQTAVYRVHNSGICTSTDNIILLKRYLKSIRIIRKWFSTSFLLQLDFEWSRWLIYREIILLKLKNWRSGE